MLQSRHKQRIVSSPRMRTIACTLEGCSAQAWARPTNTRKHGNTTLTNCPTRNTVQATAPVSYMCLSIRSGALLEKRKQRLSQPILGYGTDGRSEPTHQSV